MSPWNPWNYRVVKSYPEGLDDGWYSIREVFYDDNGKVKGYADIAIAPESDTVEGLLEILGLMRNCLDKDILDEAEMENENANQQR